MVDLIASLKEGDIHCKMITGDEKYVAAEISRAAGILSDESPIDFVDAQNV